MNFASWCETVPEEITGDRVWRVKAYQLTSFAADIAWTDLGPLMAVRRTLALSDQVYRSVGSVSANVAEGFSKSSRRDRARFYEYALDSAREARDWYHEGRQVSKPEVVSRRLQLFSEIIRLLLTMIPEQRGSSLREPGPGYDADRYDSLANVPLA